MLVFSSSYKILFGFSGVLRVHTLH